MVFPFREITDVTGSPEFGGPAFIGIHDRSIQPDWEEDSLASDTFLLIGSINLILNPVTVDRMLGQNQKELVVEPYRLIDSIPDFVPNLHVFGCKPTTNPFVLEIGMESLGKVLALAGVANEARIEIEGFTG